MSKSFPAMAVVGQSAGPARWPGEVLCPDIVQTDIIPVLVPGFVPAHSHFEDRSLIVFAIGNERHMAHDTHFLCETRVMVEFQSGHARSGGSFRYVGRRAIFPTQTFRAAGIWIFLYKLLGGDLNEIA